MTPFARHLKSGSIRLRVGGGDVEYTVHRSLLAQSLKNIDISAHERIIDFEGDEDAVACLLEFLYTGDYQAAVEETAPSQGGSDDDTLPRDHEGFGDHQKSSSTQQRAEQEVHPIILAARTSTLGVWGRPAAVHTRRWEESEDSSTTEHRITTTVVADFSQAEPLSTGHQGEGDHTKKQGTNTASTVLTHAKVYLLAERYGYLALMDFALQKLRAALKTSELELPTDHTTSLVTLIKSVYGHPLDGENQGQGNTQQHLRDVVIAQAVDRLSVLQTNGDFKAFLKDGSDFAGDLLSHLTKTQLTLQG
jgi:hypothetical protein